MKKTVYLAAFAAMLSLASCERESGEVLLSDQLEEQGKVKLSVNVTEPHVKSSNALMGSAVNSLQLMVFDEEGILEDYQMKQNSSIGELTCTKGSKKVVAIANYATSLSSISSFDELCSKRADLTENTADHCVLEGMQNLDVSNSQSIDLSVSRLVSKVVVENIALDFDMEHYKTCTVKANALYLINVPADMAFFSDAVPANWYNKLALVDKSIDVIYDNLGGKVLKEGEPIKTVYSYFTYSNPFISDTSSPTWSERPTRLVLELSIDSRTYFYPVTLDKLSPNHIYRISLTVTRPGSSSPDTPVQKYDITSTVIVEPWQEGDSMNYVI